MKIRPIALAAAAIIPAAALAFAPLAAAQTPTTTPAPKAPPSIAQLCAATGIEQVDNLLNSVARSALVGQLSPLASLVVPTSDTVVLNASVQLADVRRSLNCATPTSTPTTTPSPVTTSARPTTTIPPSTTAAPTPGDGFSQVGQVPSGAAQTGGGPAE